MADVTLQGYSDPTAASGVAAVWRPPGWDFVGQPDGLLVEFFIGGPQDIQPILLKATGTPTALLLDFNSPITPGAPLVLVHTEGPSWFFGTPVLAGAEVTIPITPTVGRDVTPPSFNSAIELSSTSVLVTFSEPVVESEALNPANYSANNGLSIVTVYKVSNRQYLLITSTITPSVVYTITASNIHDLNGNLIA